MRQSDFFVGLPHAIVSDGNGKRAMGFFYFVIGVLVGLSLIAALPFLFALFGMALALAMILFLPLFAAAFFFFGVLALMPAIGYALAIAALIVILWVSEKKRRPTGGRA